MLHNNSQSVPAFGTREALYFTMEVLHKCACTCSNATNLSYTFSDYFTQFVAYFGYEVSRYEGLVSTAERAALFALDSFELALIADNAGRLYNAIHRINEAQMDFVRLFGDQILNEKKLA